MQYDPKEVLFLLFELAVYVTCDMDRIYQTNTEKLSFALNDYMYRDTTKKKEKSNNNAYFKH